MQLGSPNLQRNEPQWVLEIHLFCGQKVKGQVRESQQNYVAGMGLCTLVSAVFF